ncbi:hypothetical protein GQ54DRAFT_300569 [Martensiomyces pterosporus]|nr:hypothetical protein GQ54DRAFT_300569 [Martensiomyces pterosporus]
MAVIRHALASQNLPESALERQLAALAVKTNKIYNTIRELLLPSGPTCGWKQHRPPSARS